MAVAVGAGLETPFPKSLDRRRVKYCDRLDGADVVFYSSRAIDNRAQQHPAFNSTQPRLGRVYRQSPQKQDRRMRNAAYRNRLVAHADGHIATGVFSVARSIDAGDANRGGAGAYLRLHWDR